MKMDLLKKTAGMVLAPQCVDKYLDDFDFFDADCFKSTLSKCLGLGIIAGSILVKLPQILKIWKNKSGEGISILSVSLDLTAIMIYACYNYAQGFPFGTWGESAFLGFQTLAIGVLVLVYANKIIPAFFYTMAYLSVCFIFTSGLTPLSTLWTLQAFNIPILLSGKFAQAFTNYQNGHTGQLSAITVILLYAGSVARIFTTVQETGDMMSIVTYVASSIANFVILFQLIYYWNVDINAIEKKKKKQ